MGPYLSREGGERREDLDVAKKNGSVDEIAPLDNHELTHVAPSGKIILTSASLITALGIKVWTGTPTMYLPFAASQLAESSRGESQPIV